MRRFSGIKPPIIGALAIAQWPDVRDALTEVFVILLFSLMPLWLGFLITKLILLPTNALDFLEKFASSSDLGILSAAFLGPLLYVILREEGPLIGGKNSNKFPSAFWFVIGILLCCVITSVIYSFSYVSGTQAFFDKEGHFVNFVNKVFVEYMSWAIFSFSTLLVFSFATIRNATTRRSGKAYQEQVSREEDDLTDQLRRAPKDGDG